jgi:hypothetical protein
MIINLPLLTSERFFQPFHSWAEQSVGNYNKLIGILFILLMASFIFCAVEVIRMGWSDERTTVISLRASYIMLVIIILLDIFLPKTYMWHVFFMFKYFMAFSAAGIYLAIKHRKDFS